MSAAKEKDSKRRMTKAQKVGAMAPLDRARMYLADAVKQLDGARETMDGLYDEYPAGEENAERYAEMLSWIRSVKQNIACTLETIELDERRRAEGRAA